MPYNALKYPNICDIHDLSWFNQYQYFPIYWIEFPIELNWPRIILNWILNPGVFFLLNNFFELNPGIFFLLNNFLNWILKIFFWIENWIESFLTVFFWIKNWIESFSSEIQSLIESPNCTSQGYPPPPKRSGCCDFFKISWHILTYFTIL